jgi:phage major head subunit gpT-like protein
MLINADTLTNLLGTMRMDYATAMQEAAKPMPGWVREMPSVTAYEDFPIAMFLATMRRWKGPRQFAGLDVKKLHIVNADHELSWAIPTNDLEDDKIGYIRPVMQQAGRNAANYPRKLCIETLRTNGLWLDGAAFYGTSRTVGNSGTLTNYATGALTETTFNTAYLALQNNLLPNGAPAGVVPTTLIVGPKNRTVAHGIVNQGPGATAANPNSGIVKVEVTPELVGTYDDYWFLVDENTFGPPVLWLNRKKGEIVAMDKPTDSTVFLGSIGDGVDGVVPGGVNCYGIHSRGEGALALPWAIYGAFVS